MFLNGSGMYRSTHRTVTSNISTALHKNVTNKKCIVDETTAVDKTVVAKTSS